LYHLIHQMSREGRSTKWISEHFGLNWRTVKRLLTMNERTFIEELERGRTRGESIGALIKKTQNCNRL